MVFFAWDKHFCVSKFGRTARLVLSHTEGALAAFVIGAQGPLRPTVGLWEQARVKFGINRITGWIHINVTLSMLAEDLQQVQELIKGIL